MRYTVAFPINAHKNAVEAISSAPAFLVHGTLPPQPVALTSFRNSEVWF